MGLGWGKVSKKKCIQTYFRCWEVEKVQVLKLTSSVDSALT